MTTSRFPNINRSNKKSVDTIGPLAITTLQKCPQLPEIKVANDKPLDKQSASIEQTHSLPEIKIFYSTPQIKDNSPQLVNCDALKDDANLLLSEDAKESPADFIDGLALCSYRNNIMLKIANWLEEECKKNPAVIPDFSNGFEDLIHFYKSYIPKISIYDYFKTIVEVFGFKNRDDICEDVCDISKENLNIKTFNLSFAVNNQKSIETSIIHTWILLNRYIKKLKNHESINLLNVHSYLLLSALIGFKMDDESNTNAIYANYGDIPLDKLNDLEVIFLKHIEFDVHVTDKDYLEFMDKFLKPEMELDPFLKKIYSDMNDLGIQLDSSNDFKHYNPDSVNKEKLAAAIILKNIKSIFFQINEVNQKYYDLTALLNEKSSINLLYETYKHQINKLQELIKSKKNQVSFNNELVKNEIKLINGKIRKAKECFILYHDKLKRIDIKIDDLREEIEDYWISTQIKQMLLEIEKNENNSAIKMELENKISTIKLMRRDIVFDKMEKIILESMQPIEDKIKKSISYIKEYINILDRIDVINKEKKSVSNPASMTLHSPRNQSLFKPALEVLIKNKISIINKLNQRVEELKKLIANEPLLAHVRMETMEDLPSVRSRF